MVLVVDNRTVGGTVRSPQRPLSGRYVTSGWWGIFVSLIGDFLVSRVSHR